MRWRKPAVGVFLCFALYFFSLCPVYAVEPVPSLTLSSGNSHVVRDRTWSVRVSLDMGPDSHDLAAFRLTAQYDEAYLTLTKVADSGSGDFRYRMDGSRIIGISASGAKETDWSHTYFDLIFRINEEAPAGSTEVTVDLDQMANSSAQAVPGHALGKISAKVEPMKEEGAFLTRLLPSEGTLEPSFSSDVLEYTMSLPYETSTLTFDAVAGDNGTVRVNRKNLNKAGLPTIFLITAVSENGKNKTQYIVTAARAEKQTSAGIIDSADGTPSSISGGESTTTEQTASQHTSSKANSAQKQAASSKISASQKTTAKKTSSTKESTSTAKTAGTAHTPEDTHTEQEPEANAKPTGAIVYGDRNLYFVGNQMPVFLIGMLCACICGLIAILLFLLLARKKARTNPLEDETSIKEKEIPSPKEKDDKK